MTKSQIISDCSKGLSEDINGEFYTIFDTNKLYDMVVNEACDKVFTVLMNKTHFLGDDCKMIADELRKAMEE